MDALFGSSSGRSVSPTKPSTQLRVQSSIVGIPVPVGWGKARLAGNLLDYQDFLATQQASAGSGGKGSGLFGGSGKGSSPGVTYTYSAAVVIGLCEGPIIAFGTVWNNKTKVTSADVNFSGFLGGYSQAAWSYMTTHHPANALNYRGMALVAAGPVQLGTSAELANYNFEITFNYNSAISGLPDADPKDVVTDLLTNQYYGIGFPSANLGTLSTYSSYCRATGMVVSPVLTGQRPAADFLRELVDGTNSDFRWTGSKLDIVPYGDVNITAHGSTYTAPAAPQYALTEADFLPDAGERPIHFSRSRPSDQYNLVRVRYLDRTNDYNQITVDSFDEAAATQYGLRAEDPRDYSFFCDGDAAQQAASLRLGRQLVRVQYRFKIGRRFVRLDAMDIVSLTHAKLGLSAQWVRIIEIMELADGRFDIIAEEYLNGTGNAPVYSRQANTGYGGNYNVAPSSINPPLIYNPPMALTNGNNEIWIGVSGSNQDTWGGCQVWVSTDDLTYRQVGTIVGNAREGRIYNTGFPRGLDPDTVNTLYVDLTMSRGSLTAGSATDRDNFTTLCWITGNELIAYDTAPLQATYKYALGLSGRTRRGCYGSPISALSVGDYFVRLDEQIFKLDFSKDHLAKTTYYKFPSFNVWGGGQETLASVPSYSMTLTQPSRPIFEHIQLANLDKNLQLSVEAGDGLCYANDATFNMYWIDRSPNRHAMAYGNTSVNYYPQFTGTVGDPNYSTYFVTLAGSPAGSTGSMFTLNTNTTPTWAQALHKAGGKFSIFTVCQLATFNGVIVPFATLNAADTAGIQFGYEWLGGGPGKIRLHIGGNAGGLSPTFFASNSQTLALGCSYDDTTGQALIMCNGQLISNGQFGGNNTSAINTAQGMTIGYYVQATLPTAPNSAFWLVQAWDTALSFASLHDIYSRWRNDRDFENYTNQIA